MKAVALFSGGLDSILAVKLIEKQGVKVVALNFHSPFFGSKKAEESAKANSIGLRKVDVSKEYIPVVKKPKFGHGTAVNPCIDCKIFMLGKAKQIAKKLGAKFVITGEVLGQRPMSQHMAALKRIEKAAGLEGKLLRPLSAKLLDKTEAEIKGWVDRSMLEDIHGRGRKRQIALAKKLGVGKYPSPAGGCLLCEVHFAARFRDLLNRKKRITVNDVEFLKYGRHFRAGDARIAVGRNEDENRQLRKLKQPGDLLFEVKTHGSPVTILRGKKTANAARTAAELTARYSSAPDGEVKVSCGRKKIVAEKPISFDEKELMI